MPKDIDSLPTKVKAEFLELSGQLSPENLSCDGELSKTQVKARYAAIMARWHALEKAHGVSVIEDQAWNWSQEVREWRQDQALNVMSQEPQHPLLTHKKAGVWVREGSVRMSAYYVWGPSHQGTRYTLWSEFAHLMFRKEEMGQYDTLDEAVAMGERFLAGITMARMRQFLPAYTEENLLREIKRLPREHLIALGLLVEETA